MPVLEINVSSNVKAISKKIDAFAYREMPFATARALTLLAGEVRDAERAGMESIFEKPKPFTLNSVRVFGATKDNLTAGVFVMDRAAQYLTPFEDGGEHFIAPGRGTSLLGPVQAKKTQYGGLPRGYVARAKGRRDMFTGVVMTKSGPINGLWRRTLQIVNGRKTGKLRLMVRFVNNKPVKEHLEFIARAEKLVQRRFDAVLGRELGRAIATSKLRA